MGVGCVFFSLCLKKGGKFLVFSSSGEGLFGFGCVFFGIGVVLGSVRLI